MKFIYNSNAGDPGIYKITNTHTDRIYIGQASRFKDRWHDYKLNLPKGVGHNKFLLNDYKKCFEELGNDDFLLFEVLEAMSGSTKEERKEHEEYWINQYYDNQNLCYNFKKTVEVRGVYSNTPEETKKKCSEASKSLWQKPEHKELMATVVKNTWQNANEEKRSKMLSNLIYERTKKHKQDISQRMKKMWENEEYSPKLSSTPEELSQKAKERWNLLDKNKKEKILSNLKPPSKEMRQKSSKRMKEKWEINNDYKTKMIENGKKQAILNEQNNFQPRAKLYYGFILSPEGKQYEVFKIKDFCKDHNLNPNKLRLIFNGKAKSHKGWKLL